jgi:hypothetical protein
MDSMSVHNETKYVWSILSVPVCNFRGLGCREGVCEIRLVEYEAASLSDWCPTFRYSVVFSYSRTECPVFNGAGNSNYEDEANTLSRNVGQQSFTEAAPHAKTTHNSKAPS